MKLRLRAPATSANLGPGFDCLGVAVDLWNEIEAEVLPGDGPCQVLLNGEGASELPADSSHLLLRVAQETYSELGRADFPRLRLTCHNHIPLARGLGSSAATRVLGVMLALELLGRPSVAEVFARASRREGHPDNVAPAVFGGLAASLAESDGTFHSQNWPVHPDWRLVVAIPEFQLETEKSRGVLPPHYTRSEAVFNLARLPWLLRGLAEGRADWLARGCQDRWHQNQRATLIPGMGRVLEAARQAGAAAGYLSGAGPTLAAWATWERAEAVAEAMHAAWGGRTKVLAVLGQGAGVCP